VIGGRNLREERLCAVVHGQGEFSFRQPPAYDIAARMQQRGARCAADRHHRPRDHEGAQDPAPAWVPGDRHSRRDVAHPPFNTYRHCSRRRSPRHGRASCAGRGVMLKEFTTSGSVPR
jgi:hypothetical protein